MNGRALWKRRIEEEGRVLNLRIARTKDQIVPVGSHGDSAKSSEALVQTVDRGDFPYIGEELSRVKLLKMVWKSKT